MLGLGIIIKEDVLKCDNQYPMLIQVLSMLVILRRHLLSSMTTFRYFYITWSRPRENELLYLLMAFLNSFLEKGSQTVVATTRRNGTCSILTLAKLSVGYLVVGITRELNKEPSLHCYPIYISYRWFML